LYTWRKGRSKKTKENDLKKEKKRKREKQIIKQQKTK